MWFTMVPSVLFSFPLLCWWRICTQTAWFGLGDLRWSLIRVTAFQAKRWRLVSPWWVSVPAAGRENSPTIWAVLAALRRARLGHGGVGQGKSASLPRRQTVASGRVLDGHAGRDGVVTAVSGRVGGPGGAFCGRCVWRWHPVMLCQAAVLKSRSKRSSSLLGGSRSSSPYWPRT